jgi:hypothetical protein
MGSLVFDPRIPKKSLCIAVTVENKVGGLTTTLQKRLFPPPHKFGRFMEINSRMLGLQCRQPVLNSVTKKFGKATVLDAQPREMFEQQLLESGQMFVLLDMKFELIDGVARQIQLEHQATRFVNEKTSNCFNL